MEGYKPVEVSVAEEESYSSAAAVQPLFYEWSHGTNPVGYLVGGVGEVVPMQSLEEVFVVFPQFFSAVRRNLCRTRIHRGLYVHILYKKA